MSGRLKRLKQKLKSSREGRSDSEGYDSDDIKQRRVVQPLIRQPVTNCLGVDTSVLCGREEEESRTALDAPIPRPRITLKHGICFLQISNVAALFVSSGIPFLINVLREISEVRNRPDQL
jgi:hypothetical protein